MPLRFTPADNPSQEFEPPHLYLPDGITLIPELKYTDARGDVTVWRNKNGPTIDSFVCNPAVIDLDLRPTGNIALLFTLSGAASLHNEIHNLRTGANVPLTSNRQAIIAQPMLPTDYQLVARNAGGRSAAIAHCDVNKSPQVRDLSRVYIPNPLGGSFTYRYTVTVEGLPQPTLAFRFSTGETGNVSASHFRASGTTGRIWTVVFSHTFATSAARSLTVTATNSSGNASATLARAAA